MRFISCVSLVVLGLMTSSCSSSKIKTDLLGFWESTDAKKKKSSSIEFTKDGYALFRW